MTLAANLLFAQLIFGRDFASNWKTLDGASYMGVALLAAITVLSALQGLLLEILEGKHTPWLNRYFNKVEEKEQLDQQIVNIYNKARRLTTLEPPAGAPPDPATLGMLKQKVAANEEINAEMIANGGIGPERFMYFKKYGLNWLKGEQIRLVTRRLYMFPGDSEVDMDDPTTQPSSLALLAPTRLGNIGRTMRSYALSRYGLDLEFFWTRFQRAMANQSNDTFISNMESSKSRLDFAVTMVFLSAATTLLWVGLTILNRRPLSEIFLFASIGPMVAEIFYGLACEVYVVFADQMRTAVDTYRFEVLKGLHVPLPTGSTEEEEAWLRLGNLIGYDRKAYTTYKHP